VYDAWNLAVPAPAGNENWNIRADLDGDNSNALKTWYFQGDVIDELFARAGVAFFHTSRFNYFKDHNSRNWVPCNAVNRSRLMLPVTPCRTSV